MIYISSKAGQKLAKAKAEYDSAKEAYIEAYPGTEFTAQHRLDDAKHKLDAAALAVADELIADRHHLVEGD